MKNGKLQAAVIGLGEGFRHIEAYVNHPDYDLVAVCDPHPDPLPKVQRDRLTKYDLEHTTLRYHDYKEVVANPDIDVVSVVSPDFFHAEQAIACMKAGKHVLCEKPMTLDLEEAAAIVRTVRETGMKFMVAHPTRYTPAFVLAKKMITRGDIGELFMVESEYAHNYRQAGGVVEECGGNQVCAGSTNIYIGTCIHREPVAKVLITDPEITLAGAAFNVSVPLLHHRKVIAKDLFVTECLIHLPGNNAGGIAPCG